MLLRQVTPASQKAGPVEQTWYIDRFSCSACGEGLESRGVCTKTVIGFCCNLTCPKETGERRVQITDVVRVT